MPIEIGEIITSIQVTDGDAALTPQAWEQIKMLVKKMIVEHQQHQMQVRAEQRVTAGVSWELEDDLDL